ncbi:MAG: HAD family hydrolase [Spirochaetaceae bacterium]|nr:HAD family hydrolase [Spirochaetaceae bacterium]
MKFQNCEAVIFDLDGTLYNKKRIALYMMLKLRRNISLLNNTNKVRKELKGIDFSNSREFYHNFFESIALKSSKSEDFIKKWYLEFFYPGFLDILGKKYKTHANMNSFLIELKNKMPIAILSDYAFIKERLNVLEISDDVFSVIASSEEYGVLKPSARPLLQIAMEMGIPADKILVVGDRVDTDGKAAELAGMMFYHINEINCWSDFTREMLEFIK